jgi:hypothetical protein
MIKHVVFFKFKRETGRSERDSAKAALGGLPMKIDLVRSFELGEDTLRSPRSWDLVLIATYDNLETLQQYAEHPEHVPVANFLKSICEQIGSVDYEY